MRSGRRPSTALGAGLDVTASAGAALHTPDDISGDALIDAADQALLAAKRRGRDQLVMATYLTPGDVSPEEPEAIRLAEGLAIAASIREAMPPLHCPQVADLCHLTAHELGVPGATVLRSRLAGWLHDIGKLAIPDHILLRAGTLDDDDRNTLRRHAEIGAAIVSGLPSLCDAAHGVRHHHERYDGTGYPAALIADQIPIEARIVAACDAYSAITGGRAYQPALDHEQALEQLEAAAGRSLDPSVVAALKRVLAARHRRAEAA